MANKKGPFVMKKEYSSIKTDNNGYLAGLFEGDGHIWISNNTTGKKHNPRLCITFGMKNEPLAKKLLEIIEFARIDYKPKNNACVLTVARVKGLIKAVNLINGRLKTPKINQLYLLIDWLNKAHSLTIPKLPLNDSSLTSDGWFAGFVDADGSFSIQHTKKENGALRNKVSCRLRIEQRMVEPKSNLSYFSILQEISLFLGCNLLTRKQTSTGNVYYSLTASSHKSLVTISNYFSRYPLYSSKYLDYLCWNKAVILILSDQHYKNSNLVEIDFLKSQMNNSRIVFNWDHLNRLSF